MAEKRIAVLAGDGIGPEIMAEALKVLAQVGVRFGHCFTFDTALVGGAAWDSYECHFPKETQEICSRSDAVLFGSIGGPVAESALPKWRDCERNSILALRKAFGFALNIRPARSFTGLEHLSPLRPELVNAGIDLVVIRELLGDVYFGEHRRWTEGGKRLARDVADYNEDQIRFAAEAAFRIASERRGTVTAVDKANVLETSRLWREVVREVAAEYPSVDLQFMYVDNCAMQLVTNPSRFDVLLTGNLFGDILSDIAAVIPGSLGLLPSASLSSSGFGMYEPAGGSAPDIAGQGVANPLGQILSAAMMLRYSFGMLAEASTIESAVGAALGAGSRTADLYRGGLVERRASTTEMGDAVASFI